jgi:hypothetical protein
MQVNSNDESRNRTDFHISTGELREPAERKHVGPVGSPKGGRRPGRLCQDFTETAGTLGIDPMKIALIFAALACAFLLNSCTDTSLMTDEQYRNNKGPAPFSPDFSGRADNPSSGY